MSTKSKVGDNKGKSSEIVWRKAFKANAEWPDKEEFLDVIYWMRQAMGIILGLFWGLLPLKGFLGLLLFVVVNAAVIYFYVSNFQKIDEEEYGGMWEITKEGFMTSFAGFLVSMLILKIPLNNVDWISIHIVALPKTFISQVTWIIVFTGLHGSNSL